MTCIVIQQTHYTDDVNLFDSQRPHPRAVTLRSPRWGHSGASSHPEAWLPTRGSLPPGVGRSLPVRRDAATGATAVVPGGVTAIPLPLYPRHPGAHPPSHSALRDSLCGRHSKKNIIFNGATGRIYRLVRCACVRTH